MITWLIVKLHSLLLRFHLYRPGADPGFEKGGGAEDSRPRPQYIFRQFLNNLAQKGVGARPLCPLWICA